MSSVVFFCFIILDWMTRGPVAGLNLGSTPVLALFLSDVCGRFASIWGGVHVIPTEGWEICVIDKGNPPKVNRPATGPFLCAGAVLSGVQTLTGL